MSAYIQESAIFNEAEIVKQTPKKAIFRNIIQTADEQNQNRRIYPKSVLSEGIDGCRSRMKRRAFLGELDHPCSTSDQQFNISRQSSVSLEGVSHIIRDCEFRGNHLYGEMETSSTPKGNILFGLLRDKSGIGFSMRGMAEIERMADHNLVKGPLTIITFDAVSQPSHKSAVVDFNEMRFESSMLTEQAGLICCGDKCYLPDYFDKLVETKMINFFDTWI